MATAALETLRNWRRNVLHRGAWKRGLVVGLIAGGIQAAVHQGHAWLHLAVDGSVLLKTILSLVIAICVALAAVAVASRPDEPSTTSE
jgi:H+/Cl- antiporter ClcA